MKFGLKSLLNAVLLPAQLCHVCNCGSATQEEPDREAIAVEALSRLKGINLDANPGVKAAVMRVLDQARGTPQFVEIVRDFKIKDQDPALLEFAVRNPGNSTGVEAMRLVLANQAFDLLKNSLAGTNAVQVAEALGNTAEKEAVPLLEPVAADPARDATLRKQAVRALSQTRAGAAALLKLVEEQKLSNEVRWIAALELNHVRWPDIKAGAAQRLPLPQGRNSVPLPPIPELVKMKGDPRRGAEIFRRDNVGCIKCHLVNSAGVDFGPDLSEVGAKLGKEALYEAILDPSAGISFGYEAWQIELNSGDEAYGLVVSETPDEIAVKTQGGIVTRYKKSEVAKREQQKLSIMPNGLQQMLSAQELVDLVEYLSSLKKR